MSPTSRYPLTSFYSNKAVSDGALSFFLDRFVRSRVSRVTYGTTMNHRYLPNNPDHRKRFSATYVDPNTGERAIRGAFDVILPKVRVCSVSLYPDICHLYVTKVTLRHRTPRFPRQRNSGEPTIRRAMPNRFRKSSQSPSGAIVGL